MAESNSLDFRVSESFLIREFVTGFAQQNRCCKAAKATKTMREKVFFTLCTSEMSESLFLSEGRTESLYRLQTVPFKTYVLNYVLASTIGKFKRRSKNKKSAPQSAEKVSKYKEKSGI